MRRGHTGAVERDEAEALRRRLYAPGASDADVERYRTTEQAAAPAEAPVDVVAAPRRRRFPVVPVVLVTLLALLGGVAVARATTAVRPDLVAPSVLPMTAADRQDIAEDLAAGRRGAIAAFLLTHPSPPALRHATRFFTIERAGVGSGTVDLSGVPAAASSGRATVLLVLGADGDASWSTFRRAATAGGTARDVQQRVRGGRFEADRLTADTFRYGSGDRPVQLRVQAPDGIRWGAAVVYSD